MRADAGSSAPSWFVQVAVCLMLVAGAGLFARSVRALDRTTLGFDPRNLLAVSVTPSVSGQTSWRTFYEALEARVAALPGVAAVGSVYLRPLSGPIGLESQPIFPGQVPTDPKTWGLNPLLNLETVTPGYFNAMGIEIVRGRGFSPDDVFTSPGAVIVSESAARRLWPGRDPIGQRMRNASYRTETGAPARMADRGRRRERRPLSRPQRRAPRPVHAGATISRTAAVPDGSDRRGRPPTSSRRFAARPARSIRSVDVSNATVMSGVVANESAPWRFMVQVFMAFAAPGGNSCRHRAWRRDRTGGRDAPSRAGDPRGARREPRAAPIGRDPRRLLADGWRARSLGLVLAVAAARAVAALLIGVEPHDAIALGGAAFARVRDQSGRLLVARPQGRECQSDGDIARGVKTNDPTMSDER